MTINYDRLMRLQIPDVEQTYTRKDTMLYALGLGFGGNPLDLAELQFVYEAGLKAVPTYGAMLAYAGFWLRDLDTGVEWMKVVHGEQEVRILRPLPVEGTVTGVTKIVEVIDKGPGMGAIVWSRRDVYDKARGEHLASMDNMTFCRGDGGFGGPVTAQPPPSPIPEREPDLSVDLAILPQQALIYRLSGDYNPLHADPATATRAGFPRPIFHGLGTYGMACRALLKACCSYDPNRLAMIGVRFSSPVYPGETLRTEIFMDGQQIAFRTRAVERNVVVLRNGRARLV
jgi:acyl dehydratase